ncbi:carboxylesterase/lipase family protein [Microbacterium stercoris]|uniref:Carboxylic ester hydrolase n=1 Tax=Microbacterium stercoris TaxID=2820289 RepID=A0A939TR55_9MICO|nr:carboxylesterase family protein [Microbacterium stercoris]MBO3663796.1 carboxylesterase family protein [Microbacterium stercoris]
MATEVGSPIVAIEAGRVRGVWRGDPGAADRSAAFLGIPFAQPPVGALRFGAPVPPEPWEGIRDAVEHGATAQRGDPGKTLIPEPSIPGRSTLNVDVFTPAPGDPDAGLPVVAWIHGGAFISGSPASPWYDGRAFNRDGVVTVSISYRLGFDGFGHVPGAPSNRGVRDWLAALEWIQRNIAAFGGDPARVTLAGQSAGGGAVLTLLGMPAAQHLFSSAWAMSAALSDLTQHDAERTSRRLAQLAGVPHTREGFASLTERQIRDQQQVAARPETRDRLAALRATLQGALRIGPVIDGDLLTRPTIASIAAGVGADKPLVIGSTDDEFTFVTDSYEKRVRLIPSALALAVVGMPLRRLRMYLADNRPQRRLGPAALLGHYASDMIFRSTVVRVAKARAAAPTWVYRFSWPSPARRWALHCLDVPFWFDCLAEAHVPALAGDHPPQRLADALHGAAVAQAVAHDPGWAAWSAAPGTTRVFDAEGPDVLPDGYRNVRALV